MDLSHLQESSVSKNTNKDNLNNHSYINDTDKIFE